MFVVLLESPLVNLPRQPCRILRHAPFGRVPAAVFPVGLLAGLLLAASAQALSDRERNQLVDESLQMRDLMLRMQTRFSQPQPGVRLPMDRLDALDISFADANAWTSMSAMLDGSLQERWFRAIEQGVLGRFAQGPAEFERTAPPTAVTFVHGDDLPWYGSVERYGHGGPASADAAETRMRLTVAPRFEDGSFLHVGMTFHSLSTWAEAFEAEDRAGESAAAPGMWRQLGFDVGYAQDSYAVQARYLKRSGAAHSGLRREHALHRERLDLGLEGFHIQGAWRITGEPSRRHYAPGLLEHIEPRDEEGIWAVVVRYANLGGPAREARKDSDSVLLGVHWRAGSTLALELDYVEGAREDFQQPGDGGLTLRGILSF